MLIDVLLADAQAVDVFHAAVALQLDVEVFAEELQPPAELLFGILRLAAQQGLGYFCADTATGGNEAFVVLQEQLFIDAGEFAVQAFDIAQGTELREVLIATLVFGQQQLVVAHVLLALSAGEGLPMAVFHQIEFTADDGLEVAFFGLAYKLESPEHIAVVGQGHAFLAVPGGFVHHRADVRSAI